MKKIIFSILAFSLVFSQNCFAQSATVHLGSEANEAASEQAEEVKLDEVKSEQVQIKETLKQESEKEIKKAKKNSRKSLKNKKKFKNMKSVKPLSDFELGRYQYCGDDRDCVIAVNGCCDCANGGTEVAVNKERLEAFRERFDCLHVTCSLNPAVPACKSGVVSCVNHKCKYFDRRFQ